MILAGAILIGIAIALMHYLKSVRNGFTRENLLSEKWQSMNAEAFIISQTMGGNQSVNQTVEKSEAVVIQVEVVPVLNFEMINQLSRSGHFP
jgi:phosphoribulokinase